MPGIAQAVRVLLVVVLLSFVVTRLLPAMDVLTPSFSWMFLLAVALASSGFSIGFNRITPPGFEKRNEFIKTWRETGEIPARLTFKKGGDAQQETNKPAT